MAFSVEPVSDGGGSSFCRRRITPAGCILGVNFVVVLFERFGSMRNAIVYSILQCRTCTHTRDSIKLDQYQNINIKKICKILFSQEIVRVVVYDTFNVVYNTNRCVIR